MKSVSSDRSSLLLSSPQITCSEERAPALPDHFSSPHLDTKPPPLVPPCALRPRPARPGHPSPMDDSEVESTASILASVKEQEAQFEKLTRALEEERRHVSAQLERVRVSPQDASPGLANGTLTRRHQVKNPLGRGGCGGSRSPRPCQSCLGGGSPGPGSLRPSLAVGGGGGMAWSRCGAVGDMGM